MADFNADILYANRITCGALEMPAVDAPGGYVVATDGVGHLGLVPSSGGPSTAPTSAYAEQSTTYTGNLLIGDHVKFTTAIYTLGMSISIDTTTPYTSAPNVASLGRVGLQGGQRYFLDAALTSVTFVDHVATVTLAWHDANTGAQVGSVVTMGGDGNSNPIVTNGHCRAYYNPGATTRVELRIVANNGLISINHASVRVDTL